MWTVPVIIAIVAIIAIAIFVIVLYNGLVRKKIAARNAWSDVDVQLKRRHDLIPNLVETVKGYASHERETLEAVIAARQQAVDAQTVEQQAQSENMLTQALGRLFALSEAYPDLKANQNFLALQEELTSTENKIGFARQHYNRTAAQYNEAISVVPGNIIAGAFDFPLMDFFEIEDPTHREVPTVTF